MLKHILKLAYASSAQYVRPAVRCIQLDNAAHVASADGNDHNASNKTSSNPFLRDLETTHTPEGQPPQASLTPEEREKRLKSLKLEVEIASQEGRRVPPVDFITDQYWEQILMKNTYSARFKYYNYLFKIYVNTEADKKKKLKRAAMVAERREEERRRDAENAHIAYGLNHVSFFLRVYDTTMDRWNSNRVISAMQFAPKLVMDCSYDGHMSRSESENTAKQLMLSFRENRENDQPFDLHYCNALPRSPTMYNLKKWIPTVYNPEFPLHLHERCFTEIFPKERLVFLTTRCNQPLAKYNPDDIYVLPALVDRSHLDSIPFARAKRLGLRMAALPFDSYLDWGASGSKVLPFNQLINIMLDIKNTGDWEHAFRHVPRRKIRRDTHGHTSRTYDVKKLSQQQRLSISELFRIGKDGTMGEDNGTENRKPSWNYQQKYTTSR